MAVWYGGGKARAPMLEAEPQAKRELWRKDLQNIKRLGFNTIRCWIDWASGEPAEHSFNFETIDVLLGLAEQEGLKVIIQIYMDAAPDWVGRKFPDSQYVSISGAVMHPESALGYSIDHPGVRRAELAFLTALAGRASKSPAFFGWDLWSEPHGAAASSGALKTRKRRPSGLAVPTRPFIEILCLSPGVEKVCNGTPLRVPPRPRCMYAMPSTVGRPAT